MLCRKLIGVVSSVLALAGGSLSAIIRNIAEEQNSAIENIFALFQHRESETSGFWNYREWAILGPNRWSRFSPGPDYTHLPAEKRQESIKLMAQGAGAWVKGLSNRENDFPVQFLDLSVDSSVSGMQDTTLSMAYIKTRNPWYPVPPQGFMPLPIGATRSYGKFTIEEHLKHVIAEMEPGRQAGVYYLYTLPPGRGKALITFMIYSKTAYKRYMTLKGPWSRRNGAFLLGLEHGEYPVGSPQYNILRLEEWEILLRSFGADGNRGIGGGERPPLVVDLISE
ncbi:MAG: hypothetical protein M1831_000186 [Alyxoria varia]|nr:MAG: hypothetical protein M1831_000186 [Alyxoria varia]